MYWGYELLRYYLPLSPLSSYFVGYTAAERRRLWWRMRLLGVVSFAMESAGLITLAILILLIVILEILRLLLLGIYSLLVVIQLIFSLIPDPIELLAYLLAILIFPLLLGTKAIRRLFRRFRRGRRPLSEHEEEEE